MRAYKCDISSYEAMNSLRTQIKADLGDVTMVVNIAGINNKSLILDLDERRVDKMINVNLKSREWDLSSFLASRSDSFRHIDFWTAMLFLPDMVKRKRGHFLSVSSTMGYVGICHQSDYVATKHALVGMNESVRVKR
jgi:all-trans-retinol dehydrogenase (NAD+)